RRRAFYVFENAIRQILYRRLDNFFQHLLASWTRHSRRLGFKKWNFDRPVRERVATKGHGKNGSGRAGVTDSFASDHDGPRRDGGGSLSAHPGHGWRRGRANRGRSC